MTRRALVGQKAATMEWPLHRPFFNRPPLIKTASELAPPPYYPRESTASERDILVEVSEALFISSYRSAGDAEKVNCHGITHIISIGSEFENDARIDGIEYKIKDIDDDPDEASFISMSESLFEYAAYIDCAISSGGRVLVHCAAGASRSPTVVLAYLLIKKRWTLRSAFGHLHQVRPCIWPNIEFLRALIDLERKLHGASTIDIDEYNAWGQYDPPMHSCVSRSAVRLAGLDTARFLHGDAAAAHRTRWGREVVDGKSTLVNARRQPGRLSHASSSGKTQLVMEAYRRFELHPDGGETLDRAFGGISHSAVGTS